MALDEIFPENIENPIEPICENGHRTPFVLLPKIPSTSVLFQVSHKFTNFTIALLSKALGSCSLVQQLLNLSVFFSSIKLEASFYGNKIKKFIVFILQTELLRDYIRSIKFLRCCVGYISKNLIEI